MSDPYLNRFRLHDLVGLIQFMGSYKTYKLRPEEWQEKLDYEPKSADSWDIIFRDHSEFLRVNNKEEVSLVWRKALPHDQLSRQPLTGEQISRLVTAALEFHTKAMERKKDNRWWIPIVAAVLAFVGALLGAWIRP